MLCLCLDAFKKEYYKHAPYLNSLRKENTSGDLETVLGFTGISVSFFTGLYPKNHGVFTMFDYNPLKPMARSALFGRKMTEVMINLGKLVRGDRFFFRLLNMPLEMLPHINVTLKKALPQRGSTESPTLFDILERYNKTFTFVDYPNYFVNRNAGMFFSYSNNTVLDKLKASKTDFKFAHFSELDYITHEHGTKSKQTKDCVKRLDEMVSGLDEKNMLLWSDHSMIDVIGKIDIKQKLDDLKLKPYKDYIYFLDTTMVRFWFKNKKSKEIITQCLKGVKNGHILKPSERIKFKIPEDQVRDKHAIRNTRCGDLIFLADSGFVISPNYFQGDEKIKAAHGYDPTLPGQKGVYIAKTQLSGKRTLNASLVDMFPTMLDMMKIPSIKSDGYSLIESKKKG